MKGFFYKICFVISILLAVAFVVFLGIDLYYYNPMTNSAPFDAYVIVRGLEFLLPSLIIFIVGLLMRIKIKKNAKTK